MGRRHAQCRTQRHHRERELPRERTQGGEAPSNARMMPGMPRPRQSLVPASFQRPQSMKQRVIGKRCVSGGRVTAPPDATW